MRYEELVCEVIEMVDVITASTGDSELDTPPENIY